jgi:S-(hydroxymethyl)glutathione dehydrogenase/alcohol dehydrogenase
MKKFAGAVLSTLGKPLQVVEGVEAPSLNRGQILVEIAYSGVCHSQVMEADGERGEDKFLPHFLGHEATGVVRATGDGVTKVANGDRVILGWIKGNGIEAGGAKFPSPIGVINAGGVTTFSQMTVVSENRLVKLPKSIPMDEGVLFGCAIPTGSGIVLNQIKPADGTAIAVWGLGGIGLSAVMATQAFRCRAVIAIDIEENKLQLAREFGATHVLNAKDASLDSKIKEIAGPAGLDYCVEAAGRADTIERAFALVKRGGGLCVFASHPAHGEKIAIDPFEMICGKRLEGSWGGASHPDRDIQVFERLYNEGKLPLRKLLTKTYRLDQINDALEDIRQRRVNRPLIAINPAL